MFRKTIAMAMLVLALGTLEAEQAYYKSVSAWMDATDGKQGIEPGAISFEGGLLPINEAFNH